MTDDEAFIRAVVDGPGDDTPRLVYADWLDDRTDPRGPYLPAEVEVFRTNRTRKPSRDAVEKLRDAAGSLDPVWTFRVTRPPLGVCADAVRFDATGPQLAPTDLDAFEAAHGCRLPAAYRALLLNWNGGFPYPNRVARRGADADPLSIESFASLRPPGRRRGRGRAPDDLEEQFELDAPGRLLHIANSGDDGLFHLTLSGRTAGQVLWDPIHGGVDEDEPAVVAKSLPELFARLRTGDPLWKQCIVRNDLAGLRAWLADGGDVATGDPEIDNWHPLEYAIQYGRPAMVRLLREHGARVTPLARQLVRLSDDARIRAAIGASKPKPAATKKLARVKGGKQKR